jgi:hypothetical protein
MPKVYFAARVHEPFVNNYAIDAAANVKGRFVLSSSPESWALLLDFRA